MEESKAVEQQREGVNAEGGADQSKFDRGDEVDETEDKEMTESIQKKSEVLFLFLLFLACD